MIETTGLRWAPDHFPKTRIMLHTAHPKASEMTKTDASSATAPVPAATSTKVPRNSAISFLITVASSRSW
ncbi:uncharacterized protein METZ01_LOCUS153043 [marine metagenome]|uniref:Uncharacterized protein n=1 Tax=marine metagenome TaxID=408172 RepID=A0A382AFN0_9ZZZZ